MTRLLERVQDAPLYRRSEVDLALGRRPVLIYCHANEAAAALDSYQTRAGRTAAAMCFHDAAPTGAAPAGIELLTRGALAERPELLVWVYGRGERGKGIVLAQHGVRDFVFAVDPAYKDVRYQPELLSQRRDELERLDAMLHDDESRLTLASIVKQRLRGEHGFLRIARYAEYSHPLVRALPGETVIDGGAFDGRTSLAFAMQAVGGRVIAFEPDPANQLRVAQKLDEARRSGDERRVAAASIIDVAPQALYDKQATLRFSAGKKGSSSLMSSSADGIEVQAVPLDHYVEEHHLDRVDLVSLDVEGAEPAALTGMRRIIERFRPKLQISIYHRREHLYELPFQVRSLCPEYVYFLGHHNTYSTETDLYALPCERLADDSRA